jgi:hypothetical protein
MRSTYTIPNFIFNFYPSCISGTEFAEDAVFTCRRLVGQINVHTCSTIIQGHINNGFDICVTKMAVPGSDVRSMMM